MRREDPNFGYKFSFRILEGNALTKLNITNFGSATSAMESIKNLAGIVNGSLKIRPQGKGPELSLASLIDLNNFELQGLGKKILITMPVSNSGGDKLTVNWSRAIFHEVDSALWDALIKTFPEQRNIFKGKMLEESLGL